MKIAILTPTFSEYSGIDRVVEMSAKDYAKSGNTIVIVTLKKEMNSSYAQVIELGMPKSQFLSRIYRLFFFVFVNRVRAAANLIKDCHIVVSHFYPMNLIASNAKKRFGLRFIYYNHGIAPVDTFNSLMEKVYMSFFKLLSNWSVKRCDDAISISRFLAGTLKAETGIRSKVINNRIDTTRFNRKVSGASIRKKIGISENAKIVLYVGRISPHKGIHLLIDAFQEAALFLTNTYLIIVGKPTFNKYFTYLKSKSGRNIIFLGLVADQELPQYYAACNVYATASLWEGFNLTIAEANKCGKPVVAFDIGPHREILKKGTLVARGNINEFAKGLLKYTK